MEYLWSENTPMGNHWVWEDDIHSDTYCWLPQAAPVCSGSAPGSSTQCSQDTGWPDLWQRAPRFADAESMRRFTLTCMLQSPLSEWIAQASLGGGPCPYSSLYPPWNKVVFRGVKYHQSLTHLLLSPNYTLINFGPCFAVDGKNALLGFCKVQNPGSKWGRQTCISWAALSGLLYRWSCPLMANTRSFSWSCPSRAATPPSSKLKINTPGSSALRTSFIPKCSSGLLLFSTTWKLSSLLQRESRKSPLFRHRYLCSRSTVSRSTWQGCFRIDRA